MAVASLFLNRRWVVFTACFLIAIALAPGARAESKLRVGKSGGPLLLTLVELGQHANIWQDVGLDVESIEFAGEAKTMQALTAGAVDLGFGSGIGMAFPLRAFRPPPSPPCRTLPTCWR